jgi:hydrogenase nickel incorporation protein HypA/HybF
MHEYSIALSIVQIAESEARKYAAEGIESIELEVGKLSGIELSALEFAWEPAVAGSLLEHALRKVHVVGGVAICAECQTQFDINEIYDACPECGSYQKDIVEGKELKIKSLTLIE